jgi:glycolate oxidase iron-sulfur subunit
VRTDFTAEQLADPETAESEKVLRTCTHCGFCTATCPTYVLLGDELDSPRGRIYLIKDMLAGSGQVSADTVPLHAPRRPCAALDRGILPPAVGRARAA